MDRSDYFLLKILRYDAAEPAVEPHFESYRVRIIPGLTILTILLRIRDEIDGTLAFRSSCRSAVCGSCAMVINGKIDLACRTQAASFGTNTIILEPLPNLQIIKDLVVDMTPFWRMYEKVKPYLIRKNPDPDKEVPQSDEERKRIDQYVNCILCASCYGACPVLARNPDYVGPAAFAKLERFVLDSRDDRPAGFLEDVNDDNGVWGCDMILRCIDACPKDVRPPDSIVGLRKHLLKYRARRFFGKSDRNED
ncbi:succinate dehydrogenase/fumarate reductase iron-sulfur subunit [Syntrophorhabdus aromaticivorans]|jgi:succinate dehydrogenase / fumarate reductase iron-sulfur subunit|uniref:succinate dehydrogenase/fumarate reductase iron-sulfur subunit n=1 Tax=Syntrophorhabdus aromaticivorans TaxID=328301 RepID=UPI00041FF7A8|nr:succinate dehydrogenase iron-sulfur subunit [Syntrophorhabdus aromaticivorans]HBA55581.1 succinate dehydrogenase iron-sulfur subunit [Syntrophorhabdus aromaticivorans]